MDNDECPICLEPLQNNSLSKLKCNHMFHTECYTKYIVNQDSNFLVCPMCRARILEISQRKQLPRIATVTFIDPTLEMVRTDIIDDNAPDDRSIQCFNRTYPIIACLSLSILLSSFFLVS